MWLFLCRRYKLHEVLSLLEADDDEVDSIFIEPPEAAVNSDEDSGDEDSGGLIDNLNGQQLMSGAEVIFRDGHRLGDGSYTTSEHHSANVDDDADDGDNDDNDCDEVRQTEIAQKEPVKKRRKRCSETQLSTKQCKKVRTSVCTKLNIVNCGKVWEKGDLQTVDMYPFPAADYSAFRGMHAVSVFESIMDDEVLMLLVHESSKYALFLNCRDPQVSLQEMRVFIAILILSGYNLVPGKRLYWETAADVRNDLVYNSMRRERFVQIMRFLHFADNTKPDLSDKVWKVRPLMNLLKQRFLNHFRPVQQLDYDESMVAYYGRHGCKQFIRGKPIRFGYKVWSLNTPAGYLVNFDVYQGKNPNPNTQYEDTVGKAAAPLLQMMEELPSEKQNLAYCLYFDNLFTGMNLLSQLKNRGYAGTGTIRDNRVPKECSLTSKKDMLRNTRGTYECVHCVEDGIVVARWVDNSAVTIASTIHGVLPLSNVMRYSQSEKKKISVVRPYVFGEYNKFMGGTDRMDENVGMYRIGVRGKKWWWPLFTWLVDVSVHNAWVLAKGAGCDIPQLEFRRQIVQTYLMRFKVPPKAQGRPAASSSSATDSRISDELRFDGRDHLIQPTDGGKRRRCAGRGCTSVGRTECRKCGIGLCVPCFAGFHTADK